MIEGLDYVTVLQVYCLSLTLIRKLASPWLTTGFIASYWMGGEAGLIACVFEVTAGVEGVAFCGITSFSFSVSFSVSSSIAVSTVEAG